MSNFAFNFSISHFQQIASVAHGTWIVCRRSFIFAKRSREVNVSLRNDAKPDKSSLCWNSYFVAGHLCTQLETVNFLFKAIFEIFQKAFWRRWPTRSSWSRRWIESCASAKQRNKICEVIKRFQYPLLIIFLFRCLFLSILNTQFWYFNIEQSFFQQFLQQCCEWWRRSKTKIAAVYLEHENHLF